MPAGRPLEYTQAMADRICELVASTGYGLEKLTRVYPELPCKQTINLWRYRVPEFLTQYAMAKLKQADILAEECLEIADDSTGDTIYNSEGHEVCDSEFVARARLRVDTRKWLAAKLLPRQYGKAVDEAKPAAESVLEQIINGKIKVQND